MSPWKHCCCTPANQTSPSLFLVCVCIFLINTDFFNVFSLACLWFTLCGPLLGTVGDCENLVLWQMLLIVIEQKCDWFITSQLKIVNVRNLFHWSTENISLYEFMFFHLLCCAAYYLVFTTNINYLFSAYVPTSMCLHRLNLPSNQMLFYCLKMKKLNCSNLNLNTIVSFFWHSVK